MTEITMNQFNPESSWAKTGYFVGNNKLTAGEAIQEAKLDWNVIEAPIYHRQNLLSTRIPEYKTILREDTGESLGVVGKGYTPVQNREAFKAMDDLVSTSQMKFHSMGSLKGGRTIWAMGKVGEIEVVPGDLVEKFIFLYNSHDGSSRLNWLLTSARFICTNMLRMLLNKPGIRLRHTKNIHQGLLDSQEIFAHSIEEFTKFDHLAQQAAKTPVTPNDWENLVTKIVKDPPPEKATDRILVNRQRQRNDLTDLFYEGTGQDIPGVRYTAWAAINAVTEYGNQKRVRGTNRDEQRIQSLMLGDAGNFANRAVKVISQTFNLAA